MIIPKQKIQVAWTGNNKDFYVNKGYAFTKYHEKFMVDAEDLPTSSYKKVKVICDICGTEKEVCYGKYMDNVLKNKKYICHSCSVQIRHNKTLSKRQDDYMKRLIESSGKLGYTILSSKDEIKNNISIIRYWCPVHGEQSMRLANMLNGKGCPECAIELARCRYKLPISEVVKRVSNCGGKIINPDEYINQSEYNLKFECFECGKIFNSSLQRYIQHGGQVCKDCSNAESLGEKKIRRFLENCSIKFEQEKWFSDCRDINPLPFDFYLPDFNTCIEFDGKQHFVANNYFKHSVEKIHIHDEIKNDYCKNNGISLIRIPYTQINDIDMILENKLFT